MSPLPADAHVHSEWSWDTGGPRSAAAGTMVRACERAVAIGLPAVVFTEHLDLDDRWHVAPADLLPHQRHLIDADGYVRVPPFDVEGYLGSIDRCRERFPDLMILTGVEFGQPHLWTRVAQERIGLDRFDRVNGSLHTLPIGDDRAEPNTHFRLRPADEVIRAYLDEVPRMVAGSDAFAVFTHLDYAARSWPVDREGPFAASRFEDEFRTAMRAIAAADRALELNTRRLEPWMATWWAEEGGRAVAFGSDTHAVDTLARGFQEATAMAESAGFRPGRRPQDLWTR